MTVNNYITYGIDIRVLFPESFCGISCVLMGLMRRARMAPHAHPEHRDQFGVQRLAQGHFEVDFYQSRVYHKAP